MGGLAAIYLPSSLWLAVSPARQLAINPTCPPWASTNQSTRCISRQHIAFDVFPAVRTVLAPRPHRRRCINPMPPPMHAQGVHLPPSASVPPPPTSPLPPSCLRLTRQITPQSERRPSVHGLCSLSPSLNNSGGHHATNKYGRQVYGTPAWCERCWAVSPPLASRNNFAQAEQVVLPTSPR